MTDSQQQQPFDALLLSQVRLGIVTMLLGAGPSTFPDLKRGLGLTQGNLGAHLRKLEEAGYVAVTRELVDRKTRSTAALTDAGRAAFLRHVARLERIARGEDG